jgi:PIN like domain
VRLLLDENVPAPLTATIKTLLRLTHDVVHVIDLDGWSGTKDLSLYAQAAEAGFEVVLTNDAKQLQRKLEVEAIAESGLHRVQYGHRHGGLVGVGLAIATVCAALPSVLQDLSTATGQQLVTLKGIDPGRDHRYVIRDPALDPPKFWPGISEQDKS